MHKVPIKPLSVNQAWKGQRYKTKEYTRYEKAVLLLLPKIKLPEAPYRLTLEYGFSNVASDIDNPNKLILDIMQKRWKFDDKHIHELNTRKVKVKKGQDYFSFKIETCV